jgi:RimJ/RimL family protein N-acetyltransferase
MSGFHLLTSRLLLRELNEQDASDMYELNNDPAVIRYTGDAPFESLEAAAAFIRAYDQYAKNGFGRWAVVLRESNEVLGWCGIRKYEEDGMTDIGYRFHQRHWGKGYATEAARPRRGLSTI